jgi:hypothetical protein
VHHISETLVSGVAVQGLHDVVHVLGVETVHGAHEIVAAVVRAALHRVQNLDLLTVLQTTARRAGSLDVLNHHPASVELELGSHGLDGCAHERFARREVSV